MSNAGMSKSHAKVPPINGVFPLDHEGECRRAARAYLICVKTNKGNISASECEDLAKAYFKCRLDNELLDPNDTWYRDVNVDKR